MTLPTSVTAGTTGHAADHNVIHKLLDYGGLDVYCLNTSGDAALIQAAITASAAGDLIRIHGPASITATIQLRDDRHYFFDSRGGAALQQAAGANLDAVVACNTWYTNSTSTNSGIVVTNLTVDGNKANQTAGAGHGLVMRAYDSLVAGLRISNARGDGLRISNEARDGTTVLAGTSVNTTVRDFFIEASGGAGVRCFDGGNALTDWTLTDGWVSASGGTHGVLLDNSAGWAVENLHIYGVQLNALDLKRCAGTRVVGNYIEDFGKQGTNGTTYYGIRATVQGDASTTIVGNAVHFFGTLPATGSYTYVRVEGNYDTPVCAVVGNTVRGKNDATREIGLNYSVGSATTSQYVSQGNNVFNIVSGSKRVLGAGVTLDGGL